MKSPGTPGLFFFGREKPQGSQHNRHGERE
jgi:hypothetical protein